jgi:hypothetical protein
MSPAPLGQRIQEYLCWNAHERLDHVAGPPFWVFFAPDTPEAPCFALPDTSGDGGAHAIAPLRAVFAARGHRSGIDFIGEASPSG